MTNRIDRRSDGRQRQHQSGRGLIVHDTDRLDRVCGVGRQCASDVGNVDATTPVSSDHLHLESMAACHRCPFIGEISRLQHQDRIAGRQQVGQAGFPGAVAGGVVHEQMLVSSQDALNAREGLVVNRHELLVVEVDAGAIKRPQHAVGDIGRARIGEEMSAARLRHERDPIGFLLRPFRPNAPPRLAGLRNGPKRAYPWRSSIAMAAAGLLVFEAADDVQVDVAADLSLLLRTDGFKPFRCSAGGPHATRSAQRSSRLCRSRPPRLVVPIMRAYTKGAVRSATCGYSESPAMTIATPYSRASAIKSGVRKLPWRTSTA